MIPFGGVILEYSGAFCVYTETFVEWFYQSEFKITCVYTELFSEHKVALGFCSKKRKLDSTTLHFSPINIACKNDCTVRVEYVDIF